MRQIKITATIILILTGCSSEAMAVQWQQLSGTTRYKVAYDEHSVRLTQKGGLEVWLRFTPRNETERKMAAIEYRDKRYRSHLEYYEIDCSSQTATLGVIDLLGSARARLNRIVGSGEQDQILPGTLLGDVASHICPVLDDNVENDGIGSETENGDEATISSDKILQIQTLLKKAAAKDATVETWRELGNLYFDTDQPDMAITAYQSALTLQPDDIDILSDQGAMYRQMGEFEHAVENFEKVIRLSPDNLEGIYNAAYIYAFDLNDFTKAALKWNRYLELDKESETAKQVRSFIDRYLRTPKAAQ